jgi:hypothetical protein
MRAAHDPLAAQMVAAEVAAAMARYEAAAGWSPRDDFERADVLLAVGTLGGYLALRFESSPVLDLADVRAHLAGRGCSVEPTGRGTFLARMPGGLPLVEKEREQLAWNALADAMGVDWAAVRRIANDRAPRPTYED